MARHHKATRGVEHANLGRINTPKAMRERKGHRKIICGGPDSSISMVVYSAGIANSIVSPE